MSNIKYEITDDTIFIAQPDLSEEAKSMLEKTSGKIGSEWIICSPEMQVEIEAERITPCKVIVREFKEDE